MEPCAPGRGTERAPCGFGRAVFHAACLRRWGAARCPHCNSTDLPLRRVLRALLRDGQQKGGYWARGPVRAALHAGPLHGEKERAAVCDAVRGVLDALAGHSVRVRAADPTLLRFTATTAAGHELEVGLQRTAWRHAASRCEGVVAWDGFMLTAIQRRASARLVVR